MPPELIEVLAHAGRQIGQFLGRLRAESEMRSLAETLQRSLLPSHLPTVPGVELASRYRAGGGSALVGGDTYDVMPLPDGRWMALVADVCGTGAEAAALTALTRHTARAASAAGCPAAVLAAVNTALLHEQGAGPLRFVTAVCLVLEDGPGGAPRRHQHRRAPAAPAAHRRRRGRGARATAGRPLGVDAGTVYTDTPSTCPAAHPAALHRRGHRGARRRGRPVRARTRLQRLLGDRRLRGAEATVAAVAAAVEAQLAGSRHEADDMALLALTVPA